MKRWLSQMFIRWHRSQHQDAVLPVSPNDVACRVEERRVVQERLSEHDRRLDSLELQTRLMYRRDPKKPQP